MDFKALFVEWLKDEAVVATRKGSKAAFQYNKAIEGMKNAAVHDLKSLKSVKYVGERTVSQLLAKLERHCKEQSVEFPPEFAKRADAAGAAVDTAVPTTTSVRKKNKRIYVPTKRSGGFAILLALYSQDVNRDGLTQDEVVKHATPFCDRSFKSNPAANQFYSAWSSVKQLEKHDLVKCSGRPKRYYLTDEGFELASKLKVAEGLATPQKQSVVAEVEDGEETGGNSYCGIKYATWAADEYEIILIIDTREVRSQSERDFFQKTISSSSSSRVKCEVLPLSVGDGIWVARHKTTGEEVVLNYIFERKRIDDLAFSIRDGRFQEQKARLKMAAMKYNYYIVEEAGFDSLGVSVSGDALQTAISMTITQSHFYLRKFKTIEDTISFLVSLTEVIVEEHQTKTLMVIKPNNIKNQSDYEPTITMFRQKFETSAPTVSSPSIECVYTFETFKIMMAKSMTTVKDTFIQMLLCIRGLSVEKAYAIQKYFKIPKTLIEFYKENGNLSEKEKGQLISELFKSQIGNKKIGPSLSEKIYQTWA